MKKFIRSKTLSFFNNKGGVGKTTIAYNAAVKFAQHGYKTVLVDLDPQCNMSRLALWSAFEQSLFSDESTSIYQILYGIINWGADVRHDIKPIPLVQNLSIVPGSLQLSMYEDLLITAYGQATSWATIGYFQTSAIQRYLKELALTDDVDLFVIDISPNLWLLNRIVMLWTDYFVTPLMPDAFSVQWIENLWTTYADWKRNRKNTGQTLAGQVPNEQVLRWEGIFLWYIINSYNQYAQQPIRSHKEWMNKIPQSIKKHISSRHCINWLVETSWKEPLVLLKDYGELSADSQIHNKAIFDLIPWKDYKNVKWTNDNKELSDSQFEELFVNISSLLHKY